MNTSPSRKRRYGTALTITVLLVTSILVGTGGAEAATGRSLSVRATPSEAAAGTAITFSGTLTRSPQGSPVRIQRKVGARWAAAAATRTTGAGRYTVRVTLPRSAGTSTYRAYAPRAGSHRAIATSGLRVVGLVPVRITLAAPATVFLGDSARLTGSVSPSKPGDTVVLQRLAGTSWTAAATLVLGPAGTFTASVTPRAATTYRVVATRRGANASAVSPSRTIATKLAVAWSTLAAGTMNTCGIRAADHTAWCWGNNLFGQVGSSTNVGTNAANPVPTEVGSATDWTALSLGDGSACGLRSSGTLWCWGYNQYGQLGNTVGNGTANANPVPTQVGADSSWARVSVGWYHACGIRTNGTLWCWGRNTNAELGTSTHVGTAIANPTPVQVGSATDWSTVSAGFSHTCAIKTNGTAWCWGKNDEGQLGDPPTTGLPNPVTSPHQVGSATTWSTISAGSSSTCATRTDGTAWCWGLNDVGQLGNPTSNGSTSPNPEPTQVGTATSWTSISTARHTCAVRTDTSAWCWGYNNHGELGRGTASAGETAALPTPAPVLTSPGWSQLVTGPDHTCGVKTDGSGWCWGRNAYGQLGSSTNLTVLGNGDPVAAPNPTPLRIS